MNVLQQKEFLKQDSITVFDMKISPWNLELDISPPLENDR